MINSRSPTAPAVRVSPSYGSKDEFGCHRQRIKEAPFDTPFATAILEPFKL